MAESATSTPVSAVHFDQTVPTRTLRSSQISHSSRSRAQLVAMSGRTPNRRRYGPLGSARRPLSDRSSAANGHMDSTPVARRSSHLVETSPIERTKDEERDIKSLTMKLWHVYHLTPLYNFRTKKSDFQHYSRMLSSFIAVESKKCVLVDGSEPGDAVVEPMSGLNVGIYDPKAVRITVKGKTRTFGAEKLVYEAILFSTDLEYNPLKSSLQEHFTYFSSMLVRAPASITLTVQNWLEVQFDCKVVPQHFRSHELAFMAAMFTGFDEVHAPLQLTYEVPSEVEGLSNITYSTAAKDCQRLWNRIRGNEDNTFTKEDASTFITGMESHFYEIFHIKLHAMPLLTVDTSIAFVGREKIKLHAKSTDNVLKVCRHLTDLALDHLIL